MIGHDTPPRVEPSAHVCTRCTAYELYADPCDGGPGWFGICYACEHEGPVRPTPMEAIHAHQEGKDR